MKKDIFVTVINCMDGRIQEAVIKYMSEKYDVNYVDNITEPGPNKILAMNEDKELLNSIKRKLDISINTHGSKVISIVGHHDCAGNLVDHETQIEDIKKSINLLQSWDLDVDEIIGLWVDENWKVHQI